MQSQKEQCNESLKPILKFSVDKILPVFINLVNRTWLKRLSMHVVDIVAEVI